jgi:RHS repeat-associated protein
VRAITNSTGAVVERAVYKPFGEQTEWLSASQPAPESKGWIGERFDADAGLQYLNARYYDPVLGMFIQPDWFDVMKPGVGTNRFSYSFNDPINKFDPGGNDVFMVNGTSGDNSWWEDDLNDGEDLYSWVQSTFSGQKIWGANNMEMGNTHQARKDAVENLASAIRRAITDNPNAEINVIGYSHGGNVIKEYSHREDAVQMDRVITLGTPQRMIGPFDDEPQSHPEYTMKSGAVGIYINVYSNNDYIQSHGGMDGSKALAGASPATAGRLDPRAHYNVDASTYNGEKVRHRTLGSGPIWDRPTIHSGGVFGQYVRPYIERAN